MKLLKNLLIGCLITVVSTPVFAQSIIPSAYNLQVTPDELNTIADALQDQPYKKVFLLMGKLRNQVVEQQQPKPLVVPQAAPLPAPQEPAKSSQTPSDAASPN